jgi:Ca2+-binding RTX toxin-like protein
MTTPLGVYAGNSVTKVQAFEQWLGKKADVVLTHLGIESWKDFIGSVSHLSRDVWSQVDTPVVWSLPLNVKGTALEDAAAGDFNSYYKTAAEWIDRYSTSEKIYIRPGWEFNGYWMPWSAEGKEQAFIDAFRQLVNTFRSVSDRFEFEWTVNIGNFGMDPADAYPGDSYVDIVGMDFYHNPAWDPADPLRAWHQMAYREYGLKWLEDFASAHGKPTAYSEWGVMTDNMQPYLDLVADWFESHDVAYQIYWDANAGGYTGKLSEGVNPNTGDAFRDAFIETPQITTATVSALAASIVEGAIKAERWAGTSGADHYVSNGGGDLMVGGKGDDTYVLSSDADVVIELSAGGVDTVSTGLGSYTLPTYVENLTFTGTGASSGTGNATANIITGSVGNDSLFGRAGNDTLSGGAGNDKVQGEAGNDTLYAGDGRDFANGGDGNDLLDGGKGDDELWAFSGDDTIRGGDGIDRLFGNDGQDRLYGGSGNDHAEGGAGNDQVSGDNGNDRLYGGDGRDLVNGGNNDDVIDGGAGDDELWALPGNDTVYGRAGADRLFGNDGNDRLSGGSGKDVLNGGGGEDTAVFDGNFGAFRIQATSTASQWKVTEVATGEFDLVANVELFTFLDATIRAENLV